MCRWYLVLCSESESENESCSVVSDSLQPHGLHSPWNSPGQNMRVGSCSLLQGIFPTLGLNSGFLHSRQILYQLSPQASAQILEWVAMPSSRDLLNPGIEPASPALQADSLLLSHWGSPDGLCGSESRSVVSNSLRPHGLYSPWNSPGQNTGLGSCSLLQGIFPTQR